MQKIVDKNDIQIDIHTQDIDKPIETTVKIVNVKSIYFIRKKKYIIQLNQKKVIIKKLIHLKKKTIIYNKYTF